jgi:hypothetical protein
MKLKRVLTASLAPAWVGLTMIGGPPAARAETPPGAAAARPDFDRERAIEIGVNAIELFHQGNYRLALERFQSAERARHSPVFLLYIARSHAKLGQLLEAKGYYTRVVAEQLPEAAPAPWVSARDDAALELVELEARIPSIQARVTSDEPCELRLDGRVVAASAAQELWLDPGEHELIANGASGRVARKWFSVLEGERSKLIELTLAPAAAPSPAPVAPTPAVPKLARSAARRTLVRSDPERRSGPSAVVDERTAFDPLGVTLLSAGALGIAAGTLTGILSFNRTQSIKTRCDGRHCLVEDADEGAAAERLALASNIAFLFGGMALASFAVHAWVVPSLSAPRGSRQLRSSLGLSGRF